MMLITKGRMTGRERRTPVLYFRHGVDLIVVASFGGNDMHPAWYLNLERCPEAEVIINGERRRLLASRVSPEEKGLVWPRLVEVYPNFAVYQQRTREKYHCCGYPTGSIGAESPDPLQDGDYRA
jgi:deazaflavin-dependent oxidoreductase (nitroreductase family)